EDGIRDLIVTGVQTCALPIYGFRPSSQYPSYRPAATQAKSSAAAPNRRIPATCGISVASVRANASRRCAATAANGIPVANSASRSEERRVGKEGRATWWAATG